MKICRREIYEAVVVSALIDKGTVFSRTLDDLLGEVTPGKETCMSQEIRDTERIEQERAHLVDGGFGDDSIEELENFDSSIVEDFFSAKAKEHYQLTINTDLLNDLEYEGEVFGVNCSETQRFYAISKNETFSYEKPNPAFNLCGLLVSNDHFYKLLNSEVMIEGYDFFGSHVNGEWMFYRTNPERDWITTTGFGMVTRLFSRNTGLLESEVMRSKQALIVGSGSVGSLIAMELARAGVENFILADSDILEIHNICRHQLGFRDLGRYKVDALSDAIKNINPEAKVVAFRGTLQELPFELIEKMGDGIIIGTGDNRESSASANDLAEVLGVPFVSTGCWQRAHAGECFYWLPGEGLPTYREAFKGLITEERPKSHQHYFADDYDEQTLNFEPGISTDIAFVTLVAVKIIYDLLNRNTENYTTRVLEYLKNYTLVCNTNEVAIGGENAQIFPHPLYISNNVSVGKRK